MTNNCTGFRCPPIRAVASPQSSLRILAGFKFEGDKHIWLVGISLESSYGVTNSGFATRVALFLDQFKNPVRRVALFSGKLLILAQERFNASLIGAKDRSRFGLFQSVGFGGIGRDRTSDCIAATSFFSRQLANAFFL